MNQLISHIEFLLHTHNCVIVPNLGGFVVNTTSATRDGLSVFQTPSCELVFNRELSHNDGLLVESYMRTEGVTFEAASQKIDDAVKEIKNELRDNKSVDLGDLGSFKMTDNQRFVYLAKPFVRPEYFGLSDASLKPIIQLQPKQQTMETAAESRKAVFKKIGIGAAAAAVIAAIMLIFPIQDSKQQQTAQILSESGLFSNNTERNKSNTVDIPTTETDRTAKTSEVAVKTEQTEEIVDIVIDTPKFYIVTGVYEVKKVADDMINLLKSEGFSDASILERNNRIDVFASSHTSREEAEQILKQLKQDFPNHKDAWVLKR